MNWIKLEWTQKWSLSIVLGGEENALNLESKGKERSKMEIGKEKEGLAKEKKSKFGGFYENLIWLALIEYGSMWAPHWTENHERKREENNWGQPKRNNAN